MNQIELPLLVQEGLGGKFALATHVDNGVRYYRYIEDGIPLLGTARTAQRMEFAHAKGTTAVLAALGHQFFIVQLQHKESHVDLRKKFPSKFVTRDELPEGGITAAIIGVECDEGNYGPRVNLLLDNDQKFTLNTTNRKHLTRVLGPQTDDWTGVSLHLSLGPVTTPDGNTITGVVLDVLRPRLAVAGK
jgi:hypothetical protein